MFKQYILKPLKRQLPFAVFLLFKLISLLPLRWIQRLGHLVGSLQYHFKNPARDIARRNIELCFPEKSKEEREALLRSSLCETGKTIFELSAMWLWPMERLRLLHRGVSGTEHYYRLQAKGRGVIALTPHLGQWEILGLLIPEHIGAMSTLYRTGKLGIWEARIKRARERGGNRLHPTTLDGARAIYAALKRNELVGLLPDQDPGRGWGVYTPFFDIDTYTMNFVARLAIRSGAGVVIAYAERLPDGSGFRAVIRPVDPAINKGPVDHSVTVMNRALEDLIRESTAQYLWIYPRFKRRPEGEPSLYDESES